jgi:hypothetical protein
MDEKPLENKAEAQQSSTSEPVARPSLSSRLAVAAIVGAFCVGGEGCARSALAGHLFDLQNVLVGLLFFVAPFFGAVIASAAIREGGLFQPVLVGFLGFVGLATGMWLGGEINALAPRLPDFLPHLLGAVAGAGLGTLWTRRQPTPAP